jgi:general secretion pathway protein K
MSFKRLSSLAMNNKKQQTGAVLLAVLVVALALVILLGVVSSALNNRIDLAERAKLNLQDAAAVYSKLNELTYLLVTQRTTVAGVSTGLNPQGALRDEEGHWLLKVIGDEIRTDGFTYTESNQIQFSIQNQAGLIGINSSGQFWLKKALGAYNLSVVEQAGFADILADYADSDDWRRPSGAESFAYEKDKKPVPRNYLLQSCAELRRLQRWSDWLNEHHDWLAFCSISRSETRNLNSIPIKLWQLFWPNSAAKISNMRLNGKWFVSNGDIIAAEPTLALIAEDYVSVLGLQFCTIVVEKGGEARKVQIEIGKGSLAPFIWRTI